MITLQRDRLQARVEFCLLSQNNVYTLCRYGCGLVYHRQEKYEIAESHFRQAIQINPSSSVLKCFLGMTLHKLGRNDEALIILQQAINSDRKNLMAWLEKARVLGFLQRDQEALEVLRQATASTDLVIEPPVRMVHGIQMFVCPGLPSSVLCPLWFLIATMTSFYCCDHCDFSMSIHLMHSP